MASLIQWTWVWVNSGIDDGQGGLAWCRVHGVTKSWTRLNNWSKVKTVWPRGLYSPWYSPGWNTRVDSHLLLQGIFLQPRDWTQVSHIAGGFSADWATREAHLPEVVYYSSLFVTAQDRKQLKCPHTGEWLSKLWFIHTMNTHSCRKDQGRAPWTDTRGSSEFVKWLGGGREKNETVSVLLLI